MITFRSMTYSSRLLPEAWVLSFAEAVVLKVLVIFSNQIPTEWSSFWWGRESACVTSSLLRQPIPSQDKGAGRQFHPYTHQDYNFFLRIRMPFHSHSLETSGKVCQFQQLGHTQPFNLQQSQNNYTCAPWGNLKLRTPPDLSPLTLASLPRHLWGAPSW